jgi:predicted RNA-binding Zn-ribbon protein involved in translation (DUF1610 family)
MSHKRKQTLVCTGCNTVSITRQSKNKFCCPNCGRPHHTHRGWKVWVHENKILLKNMKGVN